MNKTKIEWCDMTWNPVTGCLHIFMKSSLAKIWGLPLVQEYPWETAKNAGGKV